jgi:hypothetical protein
MRFFTAVCTFFNELTSDLAHALARDAELVGEFRERDRVEPTRFEDAGTAGFPESNK